MTSIGTFKVCQLWEIQRSSHRARVALYVFQFLLRSEEKIGRWKCWWAVKVGHPISAYIGRRYVDGYPNAP